MGIDLKRAIKVAFVASVALSLSLVAAPVVFPDFAIWPLIVANWLAFQTVLVIHIRRAKVVELSHQTSAAWDRMARWSMVVFSLCGLAALGIGARIV